MLIVLFSRISNSGITASRPNALGEFNDAIVITNRPLRDGEPFEIVIERMVEVTDHDFPHLLFTCAVIFFIHF